MKRILFPTDFSELVNEAFVFALRLAKLKKAEIILLHTYELQILDGQFVPLNTKELYDSLDLLEFEHFKENIAQLRILAKKNRLEDVKMYHKLALGDLNYNIKKTIEEEKIDFLVMETSGGSDWFSKILGTNTDSVLLNISAPTFIIPKEYKNEAIETIGFTTRFRDKDKVALKETLKFAKIFNAQVKCLFVKVNEKDDSDLKLSEWELEFKGEPIQFNIEIGDDIMESVDSFIYHEEIDLLAMVTYKTDFFRDLFKRSFAKKVTHNVLVPILVLH